MSQPYCSLYPWLLKFNSANALFANNSAQPLFCFCCCKTQDLKWLVWVVCFFFGVGGTIELEKLACGILPMSLTRLDSLSGHPVGPCLKQPFTVSSRRPVLAACPYYMQETQREQ